MNVSKEEGALLLGACSIHIARLIDEAAAGSPELRILATTVHLVSAGCFFYFVYRLFVRGQSN